MTINNAFIKAKSLLCDNVKTPSLDASLLLCHLLDIDKTKLITDGNKILSKHFFLKYQRLLKRRLNGECIAYITGHKEFYGLDFIVNKNVLVPRPETEILVEKGLELLKNINAKVLDLCTGSGAIAIAIKHKQPLLEVWAADISKKALAIARKNGDSHHLHINFLQSDLFNNIKINSINGYFDMIITNPPYVCSQKIKSLDLEVQREPRIALDGGKDGLDLIRRIIKDSMQYLLPGGILIMEADSEQMPEIKKILNDAGFRECNCYNDLSGQARVISARFPG